MLAGAMFVSACSSDGSGFDQVSEKSTVAISLGIDGVLATRAASEMNADMLVYSLFDANGNLVANDEDGMCVINNAFKSGATENVSLSLLKGQTYTITFWAQNSTCDAYDLTVGNDGLKVNIDYNGGNNDEYRDAFFASETFTVEDNTAVEVVLKRPFAQINLGVTAEDWNTAVASGVNITESKVVIKNAATSINLLDGSVSGDVVVDYDFAAIPSSATRAADVKNLAVNDVNYKWLSMSYILTDESKSTLDSDGLQFTLKADDGTSYTLDEGLHNVPVQRNWRTNVVGNVLTGDVNVSVSVDPVYYSTSTVSNVDEFNAAVKDRNIQVIKLNPGTYDIHCVHNKGLKTIESADVNNPATITGLFAVACASVEFNNVNFTPSETSLVPTGHQYIDRMERKSIVPIYAGKAKFTGCNFTDLYNSHNVVSINYQAQKPGTMLEIDNCSFQGYAYTIYSRALISVTNCTFDQVHPTVAPRAIFLYGLGDGTDGKVIFKNNKATNKTSYAIQMSSSNYDYKNINFDVQGNDNFTGENGNPYLVHPDRDFTGCTFADGSEIFDINM